MKSNFTVENLEIYRIQDSTFKLRPIEESMVINLMKSIKNVGLLQPISTKRCNIKYKLIFGRHRLEACKRLGWTHIPSYVLEVTDEDSFLLQITENIQRNQTIDPIAEAQGYQKLLERGWTLHQIGKKIGMSDSYVFDRINLARKLDPTLKKELSRNPNGLLSTSHAIRIASIKDKEKQRLFAKIVKRKKLSVHQLEKIISIYKSKIKRDKNLDFITEMYETHPIGKWKNGVFMGPEERICILRTDSFNKILKFVGDRCFKVGKACGRKLSLLITQRSGNLTSDGIEFKISEFNKRTGFGQAKLKEDKIELKHPATDEIEFFRGYFEGFLDIKIRKVVEKSNRAIFYFQS